MRFFVLPLLLATGFVAAQVDFEDLTGEYAVVHAGINFCGKRLSVKVDGKRLNSLVFDNSTEPCTIPSSVLARGMLKENHPNRDQLGTGVWTTTPLECGVSGETIMDVYKPLKTFSYRIEALKPVLHKAGTKYVHLVRKAPPAWCVYQESGGGSFSAHTPPPEPGSQDRLAAPVGPDSSSESGTARNSSNPTASTTSETGNNTSTPPTQDSDSGIAPRSPNTGMNNTSPSPGNGTQTFPSSPQPNNRTNSSVSSPSSSRNTTSAPPTNDTNSSGLPSDSNTNNASSPPKNDTSASGSSPNSRNDTDSSPPNKSANTSEPPSDSITNNDSPPLKTSNSRRGSSSNSSRSPTTTDDPNPKKVSNDKNKTESPPPNENMPSPRPAQKAAPAVEVLWLWLGPVIGAVSTIIGAFITVWCVRSRRSKNESSVQVHVFTSDYKRSGNEDMSLETLTAEKMNNIHRYL